MGYATSLFNLMRNIGGSIGIADHGTMLRRQRQAVGAHARRARHASTIRRRSRCSSRSQAAFIAAGSDAVTATNRAYAVLHGMLLRQASMVSFVTLFRLLGLLFLADDPAGPANEKAARPEKGECGGGVTSRRGTFFRFCAVFFRNCLRLPDLVRGDQNRLSPVPS